jgi:hypothetical protein
MSLPIPGSCSDDALDGSVECSFVGCGLAFNNLTIGWGQHFTINHYACCWRASISLIGKCSGGKQVRPSLSHNPNTNQSGDGMGADTYQFSDSRVQRRCIFRLARRKSTGGRQATRLPSPAAREGGVTPDNPPHWAVSRLRGVGEISLGLRTGTEPTLVGITRSGR